MMLKIYGRMKTKSALVRSDRAVELYAVSCVYLNLSVDHPPTVRGTITLSLRLYQSLQKSFFSVLFLICIDHQL